MPSGCRMGICFGCVAAAARRRRARPAHRRHHDRRTRRRRAHPDLRLGRGRRLRHRPLRRNIHMTALQNEDRQPDRPPHRRRRRGPRPRARRDPRAEVVASRGERDAAYIRKVINVQRTLELGSRAVLLFSLFPPAWLVGTAGLSIAKILENMEIGHNVMHGQWDWMRDPKIHSTTWEWDNASPVGPVEALAQRAAPHLHQRDRQDNDLGYGIMRVDEDQRWHPFYLGAAAVELPQRLLVRVRHRGLRPRARQEPARRRSGTRDPEFRRPGQAGAAQDPQAGDQGLRRCTRCCPARRSCTTLAANLTANLVRNLWTHSVIMCGHFPEGVETFEKTLDRRRDPRRVVPAPDARLGQHQRQPAHALHDRQPVVTRSSTTCSPTCRATATRRSRPKVQEIFERYGLTYTSGPLPKQVALGVVEGHPALAAQRPRRPTRGPARPHGRPDLRGRP